MTGARVRVTWRGDEINAEVTKAMAAGFREAGKHGRKVQRARIKQSPGSAEGGPPGSVSKNLRKSIAYRVRTRKKRYIVANIGVPKKSPYDSRAPGKSFPGRMNAQATRLARGFTGKDRLGRTYHQRGRPFADLMDEKNTLATKVRTGAAAYMPRAKTR